MSSSLQRGREKERPSLAPPTFYSDDEEDEEEVREKISMRHVSVFIIPIIYDALD